jgi:predicted transcriptional regulator
MRRSREQIMEQILKTCLVQTGKTTIVYQCNLNFRTVNPHLRRLIKAKLLNVQGNHHASYSTSPKGKEVLEHIDALRALQFYDQP